MFSRSALTKDYFTEQDYVELDRWLNDLKEGGPGEAALSITPHQPDQESRTTGRHRRRV